MADTEADLIRADRTLAQRFWAKVEKAGPDDCWIWTGATRAGRYGNIRVGGKRGPMVASHRIQMVWCGKDPGTLRVLHTCDNGLCVNPAHLFLGTQADNVADMIAKGRHVSPGGLSNGNSVLTEPMVREVRTRAARGESVNAIAEAMGVGRTPVYHLLAGKSYKGVADDVAHPKPSARGVQNAKAVLNGDQVVEARRLFATLSSYAEVARRLGISQVLARRVIIGERYSDITEALPLKRTGPVRRLAGRSLDDASARQVLDLARKGEMTAKQIARQFGISEPLVYAIKHGRAYSWLENPPDA